MTTIAQTLGALKRRPLRTFLTALGTALGIATIVALLAISDGAQQSAGRFLNLGSSDLGVFQKDAADPTTSVLPLTLLHELQQTPGIAQATPIILLVQQIRHSPAAFAFGAEPNSFVTDRYVFTSGHMFSGPHEAVIGTALAASRHLHTGGTLTVAHRAFRITGVYHIGVAQQDQGAVIPLAAAQAISGKAGEATTIALSVSSTTSRAAATREINRRFPGLLVIGDGLPALRAGVNGQLLSNLALVLAAIALMIGGIGVMNTMLMAVIERRAEFALLSAVGWSGPQIAARVIIEGVVTTVIGAAIGLLLGTVGAHFLVQALGAQEFVAPDVTAWDLGRALLVGVLLGVLGGLYPAWRAARVSPAQVLAQR
ncbi:MAG: ABC transporter permease [Conexibacteraceae bacterium]|nr:ABC transporter permease [Conexibacteraceae bacterium]